MMTQIQMDVINAFATRHGRKWKSILQGMWMNGSDVKEPDGDVLRQIRNTFGPSTLKKT